jgi:hypothetical protein
MAARTAARGSMFNPTKIVIDAFCAQLQERYQRMYGLLEPEYPGILAFVARLALENIANSDAPYHDVAHTILVTEVGQEMLYGKHISEGGVSPRDWLHFVVSLLCHDIGYVRGVCRGDRDGRFTTGEGDETVELPQGATDASLTAYHISRGKLFISERFGRVSSIDAATVIKNIEHTRFPVPDKNEYAETSSTPGLVRAADLVGQLSDIGYLRKIGALYREFEETGMSVKLGYKNADDLRVAYPSFFWKAVSPYIGDGLRYLRVTQEGQQWIANLFANVFLEEHRGVFGSKW